MRCSKQEIYLQRSPAWTVDSSFLFFSFWYCYYLGCQCRCCLFYRQGCCCCCLCCLCYRPGCCCCLCCLCYRPGCCCCLCCLCYRPGCCCCYALRLLFVLRSGLLLLSFLSSSISMVPTPLPTLIARSTFSLFAFTMSSRKVSLLAKRINPWIKLN